MSGQDPLHSPHPPDPPGAPDQPDLPDQPHPPDQPQRPDQPQPDAERWKHAREIFDTVVVLDGAARAARLDEMCRGDVELRREVESLLTYDRSHDTIARVVADAALHAAGVDARLDDDAIPPAIGRYRVLAKLGEGGMGRVFLAEDTSLGRRVAIKVPPAALTGDETMRTRLQREARAAATLNHPHVCVVHEVGEAPRGRPFIAMEYIDGETLAARLTRGPLPLDEVLAVGRQATSALREAHAKGVVHRDLKPSNIMLTAHGIKLLDFGLATVARDAMFTAERETSGLMGTIPYMSPEQVRSEAVDQRTDLFSLGTVLYEAATGHLPFEAPTARATCDAILNQPPQAPSERIGNLPAEFDQLIARALQKNREDRYQNAEEFGHALEHCRQAVEAARGGQSAIARTARNHPVWVTFAALAVAIAGGLTYRWLDAPMVAPAENTVLVGNIANTTGDPTFDGTLDEAVAVSLQQTPFLHIVPDASVKETLRQMTRGADEQLTDDIAREICRRRGISAWISGSIAPARRGFAITIAAMDGVSGRAIASERIDVDSKLQVLGALGTAVGRIRAALGESPESITRFGAAIETATTASLDALKAYTLGIEQSGGGNYLMALSLFERAVQIDPEFAVAYRAMAKERSNLSYSRALVAEAATRAYELRNRATEQERLAIEASYHSSVTGDLDEAIAANTRWARTYPNDWRPHHSLGDLFNAAAQYDKSVEYAGHAVRLNPDLAPAYSNLAGSLFALDRFEEAREVYRQAMARGLDAPEYHAFLWRIAYYLGDTEEMQRQFDWAAATSSWSFNMPSLAAALQGRWREAQRLSGEAREVFARRNMPGPVALAFRYEALTGALVGDCDAARLERAATLNATQDIDEQARVGVALGLCDRGVEAARFAGRLAKERPHDTMLNRVWLPLLGAAAELDRSPSAVIEALEPAKPYEGAAESLAIYLRGLALLRLERGAEARAEFQKIVDHRGRTFWHPVHPLAYVGLARASALAGDLEAASRTYHEFFNVWKNADADLPVVAAARKESEALGSK